MSVDPDKCIEGPLNGRIILFLFDNPEGVTAHVIRAQVMGAFGDGNRLNNALARLEAEGVIESVIKWVPAVNGSMYGYRLTLNNWLKLTRSIQDVGRSVEQCCSAAECCKALHPY